MIEISKYQRLITSIAAITLLAGCNTTAPMVVETSVKPASFQSIATDENSASFALTKLINDIDRDFYA